MRTNRLALSLVLAAIVSFVLAAFILISPSIAQEGAANSEIPANNENLMHPNLALLDVDGRNVLQTGKPVSTMQTCGTCHDTTFIASHSVHADAGLSLIGQSVENGRAWENGAGWYGSWSPLLYRYLSNEADNIIDLGTAEWLQTYGLRYVGGLVGTPSTESLDTRLIDAEGNLVTWNWAVSGNLEMNCFLCHLDNPDNNARISSIEAGQFAWASTATLNNTGLVSQTAEGYSWNASAFDTAEQVLASNLNLGAPSNENCGQCHGLVHSDARSSLVFDATAANQWTTWTTGQVYSPQRISNSGMNISDKNELGHSWDIHAERAVNCVDCHYALNNPMFFVESEDSRPEHLVFDPRRMEIDEYINRPLHQFANGGYAYSDTFSEFERAERSCESCHDAVSTHEWLAYPERHISALACETCHIPTLYAPALETVNWTVLNTDASPILSYRGLDNSSNPALITGYQPILLPQTQPDGSTKIAPFNLISSSYWVYGEPARPVPLRYLEAAWLANGVYQPEILVAFDANGDGSLDSSEIVLDTDAKISLIQGRLAAAGLENPRIVSEVQAYAIHHNVTAGENGISECSNCHSEDSILSHNYYLGAGNLGVASPMLIAGGGAVLNGSIQNIDNLLYYQANFALEPQELYILGKSSVSWVDWLGIGLFLATFVGVLLHGGLRYYFMRRRAVHTPSEIREVYMYSIYERQWHWLQTAAIFGLIFTGLVIHKPEMFGMFSFSGVVFVHNGLALILVVNAALSAFYHLVSGEIRQFLPRPYGFFDRMFAQAKYYLYGIFKGEAHPFEKSPEQKMNPIQQLTYFGLLNVLLPLQVITGALMWGAQGWPEWTAALGGLPFLAPFHSLIAWLLSSFIVLHVYMTTTGHEPLGNIKAMIFGWDAVESHSQAAPDMGD